MSVVRTVLGDVSPGALGRVDMHDHLLIAGGPAVDRDPDLRIDDREDAAREATAFRQAGGGTIVDAMPSGCGRDAEGLVEVTRSTGVHVVATAGFHTESYYDSLHWARRYPGDRLARVLARECLEGFDRWDFSGPETEPLRVRPGVLKCAFGLNAVTAFQRRSAAAVAAVHGLTGLPVLVHLEHGTGGDRAVEVLSAEGVAPGALALCHVDRTPDLPYHLDLLASGAQLVYDGLGRERYRPTGAVVDLVAQVVARGLGRQVLLGGDLARRSTRQSAGGRGIAGLLTDLVPRLRAAVSDAVLDDLLINNAARFLALRTGLEGTR